MDTQEVVDDITDGWGADIVFEASGSPQALLVCLEYVCPAGTSVMIGMPLDPVPINIVKAQAKEITLMNIFRYSNDYNRAIRSISSGDINIKPLITSSYPFGRSKEAYEYAATFPDDQVKIIIDID